MRFIAFSFMHTENKYLLSDGTGPYTLGGLFQRYIIQSLSYKFIKKIQFCNSQKQARSILIVYFILNSSLNAVIVSCLFFRHFLGNQTEINENLNKNYKIKSKQTN